MTSVTAFKFTNGDSVKDIITKKKGIVTGNVDYITGCKQCLISPEKDDAFWSDQDRLTLIKSKAVTISINDPGCDVNPPIK